MRYRTASDETEPGVAHAGLCGAPRFSHRRLLLAGVVGLCLQISGCGHAEQELTETKRLNELVTEAEWATFVKIVDHLQDHRLPAFPAVFLPPPQWQEGRTALVPDLCLEEIRKREECWEPARLAPVFARHKPLARLLQREEMSAEQFAGLLLSIGAATCRSEVPAAIDLVAVAERAHKEIDDLKRVHQQAFTLLSPESRYTVVVQAMWIARMIRAEKLLKVPAENLALVKQHRAWLERAFPEELLHNPAEELQDLFEERGLPFEELPESGSDEDLDAQLVGSSPAGR